MDIKNLERIITTCTELGATLAYEKAGMTSGEISLRQAKKVYGKWFIDAVNDGRIYPVRVENGHAGTKFFKVSDILKLKTLDAVRAELILN